MVAGLLLAGPAAAQEESEFAPFRITDIEGTISLRYHRDDVQTTRSADVPGAVGTSSAQDDRRSEASVNLSARGFIYHPKFIALDLGLGTIYQRSRVRAEVDGSVLENRFGKGLYDLSLRGVFFRGEPYSGALFYEHLNPSVSVGPAVVVLQTSVRRGLELTLLEPFTPVPMSLEASDLRTQGRGSGLLVDDKTERIGLTAGHTFGQIGSTRLRIDGTRQDSASGSVDLPIVRSTSDSLAAGLDTRLQFGADQRHQVTNLLTYSTLRYGLGEFRPADRKDARALLNLRSRQSATLHLYGGVDAGRVRLGALHSRALQLNLGASWQPADGLSTAGDLRHERLRTSEYSSSLKGVSASADYRWALLGGAAQLGYVVRYDERSQATLSSASSVFGERHVLAGVSFVTLTFPNGSVGSVRVFNESRSQQYLEGRDYLVSPLGNQLRLQRRVGGDIADGQSVLVDYVFEPGGSYDARQVDQTASLIWSWRNRFSLFIRGFDSSPHLVAGRPSNPLNTVRSRSYGARAEWPLATLWTVGGSVEQEDRRETVLPFKRSTRDLFVFWEEGFIGPGGVRVDVRRLRVAYDTSAQDVDLSSYDLHYWVYTPLGFELQADWSSEQDRGGIVVRRRDLGSLRARWRYRQLLMTLSLTRTREEQGGLHNRRTLGQFLLQRTL
jgi:hypothetical protein